MSASPAKRPRTAGSFSPPSPPYHQFAKSNEERSTTGFQPTTPASPPYMPSNAGARVSDESLSAATSSTPSATQATSLSFSPPSTAPTSQPQSSHNKTGDADEVMADVHEQPSVSAPSADNDVVMSEVDEHRRSDHDRQSEEVKTGVAARVSSTGGLFKLCDKPYSSTRPHATQDLIALYSLNSVATSVARKDPVTGAKINKLRKSYEGHIKSFGLSGRPKSTQTPSSLLGLVEYPDEEWFIQKEMGNTDINKAQLPSAAQAKLDRALINIPISVKGSIWNEWRQFIATDDGQRGDKPGGPAILKNGVKPQGASQSSPGTARPSGASTPNAQAIKGHRPERAGTKRRYNDGSFEGYGEGFGDDTADSADDSVRNGGMGKKKRRKDASFPAGSPLGMDLGGGSGRMVDVRR